MSTVLSCKNFGFALAETTILRGLSFGLEAGGYLSVIGPNGSGKSTLLKCLLRLHDTGRRTGAIRVAGRDLASFGQRELARLIAYVPQAGGRIPLFTVMELLKLSRYPYASRQRASLAEDDSAVAEALKLTGTEHLAAKPLTTLSGGERQKAYLAAALAQGTGILLLDEPASFLDPRYTAELNALLKRLHREQGLSIVTVTHDLNHPLDAGGQVLVLRHGEQLWFGPSEELATGGVLEEAFAHTFSYMRHPVTGKTLVLADQAQAMI